MKTIKGDLIKLALQGNFDVIIHGCNCFNTMGSGIAKQVRSELPEAWEADQLTVKGDKSKLGLYTRALIELPESTFTVINAYTQYKYGTDRMHVDYKAVRSIFKNIKVWYTGKRIAYPMIGAGLAGGDWEVISNIINEELKGEDHTLVLFEKVS